MRIRAFEFYSEMILTIATGSMCVMCVQAKTIAIAYEVSSRAPAPAYYFEFSFSSEFYERGTFFFHAHLDDSIAIAIAVVGIVVARRILNT